MRAWETTEEIKRLAALPGPEVAQMCREGTISRDSYLSVLSEKGIPLWSGDPRLKARKEGREHA